MNSLSDEELVQKCKNGDEKSLNILLERHRETIFKVTLVKACNVDVAEDLTQEICIKLVNNIHKYKESSKFKSWLITICYNHIFDYFRKQKVESKYITSNQDAFKIGDKIYDKELVLCDDTKEQLNYLLSQLIEPQRIVVIERMYNDKSFKEICHEHGMKKNTALGRMRQALMRMRKIIKDEKIEITS